MLKLKAAAMLASPVFLLSAALVLKVAVAGFLCKAAVEAAKKQSLL